MLASVSAGAKSKATPRQALAERALRELARRNFINFCMYMDVKYETPPHIRLLAAKLQQVAKYILSNGKDGIGRLMIMMPPQHGKSLIASKMFPTWMLGLSPDSRVILASYGVDLAVRHSRFIRDAVMSAEFTALFGRKSVMEDAVVISSDSRSAENWDLAQPYYGGVKAAGVGGGITGLPAHLLIVDDPFKNREEAESESRRDLVDDWYRSSARTRLRPNAAVVIFHTRWHPDDLAGRLMRRMTSDPLADQWEIINLPALALDSYPADEAEQRRKMNDGVYLPLEDALGRKPGQPLWPLAYTENYLIGTRAELGLYDFEALYQQMPYLREGGMFKREYFDVVSSSPENVSARVMFWDKAGTRSGREGDKAAGVLGSITANGDVYIEFVIAKRMTPHEREETMARIGKELYTQYGPFEIWHQQDPGSAGLDSALATNDNLANAGLIGHFETVSGKKLVRAGNFATKAEAARVHLVYGSWNQPFVDALAAFTGRDGDPDDEVDAASSMVNKLLELRREPEMIDEIITYEERVNISPV